MPSFRMVWVPQCGMCSTAVTDRDGREVVTSTTLLEEELRSRLAGDGWRVRPGQVKYGRQDPLLGDSLLCPSCSAAQAASLKAARDDVNRPAVKEVDMETRLGAGWTLRQREGDAETQTWLVVFRGEVRGRVRRYRRRDETWSRGWLARRFVDGQWAERSATKAGALHRNSSFLWRSRDLAAWGIAAAPKFTAPNPSWSTRRQATVR